MIALLIANWKSIAAAAAAFALSLMMHKLDVHRIEARHEKEIASVRIAMTDACNKVQETTRKVSNEYQKNLANLNARLAAARRLHDNSCVAVAVSAAAGHDAAAAGAKSSGRNVSSDRLIEIAGKGEKYRLQLLSCQQFINLENGVGEGK